MSIRLVTFDALHTIITPRLPLQIQYSRTFEPYFGQLDPALIKSSMRTAIKKLQAESPIYNGGSTEWWKKVIKRTALGAGADVQAVDTHLDEVTPRLMKVFSSKEGYREFNDTINVFQKLRNMGLKLAVVSNADSRMRGVLDDLNLSQHLECIVLSEEVKVAKPDPGIFFEVLRQVNEESSSKIDPEACLHVGDELEADYHGAKKVGMDALLLRRLGAEGEQAHVEEGEVLEGVSTIPDLYQVVQRVEEGHGAGGG